MPVNVGQRFLKDPEEYKIDVVSQRTKRFGNFHFGVNPAAQGEAVYIPFDRGRQTGLFQQWRVQQVRQCPNLCDTRVRYLSRLFELAIIRTLTFGRRQHHAQRGEILAHAVVQLPRNMPPFFILGSYQTVPQFSELPGPLQDFSVSLLQFLGSFPHLGFQSFGESPEALLALAQRFCGLLLLRDVIVRFQNGLRIPAVVPIESPAAEDDDLLPILALVSKLAGPAVIALKLFGDAFERLGEFGS